MATSLRHLRTSQLMSISELAVAAGVTPKTLTDIEYGRRRPSYETMRNISKALGVSAHDIQEFVVAIESRSQWDNAERPKLRPKRAVRQVGQSPAS
jgi:transcriptional regulator with XRE-family HTH domain